MKHKLNFILFSFMLLLTFCNGYSQKKAKIERKIPTLLEVNTEIYYYLDSLKFTQHEFPSFDNAGPMDYHVYWGKVERNDDTATIYILTTVTGADWQAGSIKVRKNKIYLNIEHVCNGRLAAVAIAKLFEFKIVGLGKQNFEINFGRFILTSQYSIGEKSFLEVNDWKARNKPTRFKL